MLRSGYKDARDYEHYKRLAECYLAVNNSSQAYEYLTQAYALIQPFILNRPNSYLSIQ